MLSRVADTVYWMARYMERAENLARLLLANQNLRLDSGATGQNERDFWEPILMTTGGEERYHLLFDDIRARQVEEYLSVCPENSNSIVSCVRIARENMRMVRDQITDEMWRSVNDLHLFLSSERAAQMRIQEPTEFYEQVIQASCLFQGVVRTTMLRDETWQFFQIGTYLERADKTSRLVDMCSAVPLLMPPHPDARPLRWLSLLHSCSAYHGYREVHNQLDPHSVLKFLFLSPSFARSVRFSVREVARSINKLLAPPGAPEHCDPVRASGRLRAELDYGTLDGILEIGIHEYIDRLQTKLNAVGNAIFETFVLYADKAPTTLPAPVKPLIPAGAWHADLDMQIQQ